MRKLTMLFVAVGIAAIVAACSSSGSSPSASAASSAAAGGGADLTGKTWKLTAITEKVPAFQGVVPAADQANYTIEFKADGTFAAKADCNQLSGTYTTTPTGGLTIVLGPSHDGGLPSGIACAAVRDRTRQRGELRDLRQRPDHHAQGRRDARLHVGLVPPGTAADRVGRRPATMRA